MGCYRRREPRRESLRPPPGWTVAISNHWVGKNKPSERRVVATREKALPAGQCVLAEEVRANFDASVTRLVTRGNEVVDQITFKSSYRPTNRMYLIGIGGR